MARHIVKVGGQYRMERFDTTLTDPKLVTVLRWARLRTRLNETRAAFNRAGQAALALAEGLGALPIKTKRDDS